MVRGCSLQGKKKFLCYFFKFVAVHLTTKSRGGGLKALMDCKIKDKKKTFYVFVASLTEYECRLKGAPSFQSLSSV